MELMLYNKDLFNKETNDLKTIAIVNMKTVHYNNTAIIVQWDKETISIEIQKLESIQIDNEKVMLRTDRSVWRFDNIDSIAYTDEKLYHIVSSIWGVIRQLWGYKK